MKIEWLLIFTCCLQWSWWSVRSYSSSALISNHQTTWQRERFEHVKVTAREASERAKAELIDALDKKTFREQLADCCPRVANLSSLELLQRIKEKMQTVEVVSGFSASPGGGKYFDMSIEEGSRSDYFESTWEAMVTHNASFNDGQGWWSIQDDVETKLYGLKPFSKRGDPASLDEAHERGIYTLLNTAKMDAGSPLYGSVTAVLNRTRIKDTLLLSAIDTGEWTALCNSSYDQVSSNAHSRAFPRSLTTGSWPPSGYDVNCSAYDFNLGTLEYFEHVRSF